MTHMLEQLFGSRTRVKLLRLLLLNPEKAYYVRQLTRLLDEQINSVRRELGNMAAIDLVLSEEKDQKKFYRANPDCLLYDELQALVIKSHLTLEKDLVHGIKDLENVKLLVLTGIFTEEEDARTDILCVGDVDEKKFRLLIKRFRKDYPRDLNFTMMGEEEYRYRKEISDKFLHDILDTNHLVVVNKIGDI